MGSKSPDENRKNRSGHRPGKVSTDQEGATGAPPARCAEETEGDSAHEVREGKLIKKPATESGK